MSKLALLGGEKSVQLNRNHYEWPIISHKTRQRVMQQLDESISIYDKSGVIDRLENELALYHDMRHALLTSSGTAALHSMFVGADLKEGDEVICPAYTFFATITPLFFTGAVPILADSDEDGNISPASIERKITPRTRAIIVVHMWGHPCKMDEIVAIAQKHNLLLFEDGSHAHGAVYKNRKVGSFGHASAFSLQGQKTLTGGEGGFLLTNEDELFYRALLLGHYNKRCRQQIPKQHDLYPYTVTGMGLKLRIHPIAAAIAAEQFEELETVIEQRNQMAETMNRHLSTLPGITIRKPLEGCRSSWYAMILQYDQNKLGGLPLKTFHRALLAEGCRELDQPSSTCPLNYHPLFQNPGGLFPSYSGKFSYQKGDFPVAERFFESTLKLPVWHRPEDQEIFLCYLEAFKKVIQNHEELLYVSSASV